MHSLQILQLIHSWMYLLGHFQIPDKARIPNPNRFLLSYQVGSEGELGSPAGHGACWRSLSPSRPLLPAPPLHYSVSEAQTAQPVSLLGTSTTFSPDIPTLLPHRPLTPFLPCPGPCGIAGRLGVGGERQSEIGFQHFHLSLEQAHSSSVARRKIHGLAVGKKTIY